MSALKLSPFQQEKLQYYFNFFVVSDSDGNGQLELSDLDGFMKKVLDFTGWDVDSQCARECHEVHECFFHTLMEKAEKGSDRINLAKWFRMWDGLIPGCMSMRNFPVWLRLLPKSLFRIIDKKGDEKIDAKELADFYVKFVGIPEGNVTSLVNYAMEQMTDHGKYPLTLDSYNQMFANFLIGRTPYGPGRFIFGCFEHMVQRTEFQLIQGPSDILQDPLSEFKRLQIAQHSPQTPNSLVKVKFFRAA
ncbi:sarcoplasmic calcium-binding proteins I, III, and IV-like isoform X1 [Dreissena polymorpha]|uniref:sarcoplasmic calcium-binding proteins I, III, and IV-like isoform X1 n=1 Tax=Dreissena polymorpha TaxID=45954 RepID=UPI0022645B17|nr:sarcoplasmic calcium-binding proteins I, III, and IV-like isoform X1 [Dreissena polymorpha]XP_052228549.1 sarcoplasmic calcium-binding proteins I, III, and IV-like isoform X1 [Dreissena polymorpha]